MSSRKKGKILPNGGDSLVNNPFVGLDFIYTVSENTADIVPAKLAKSHTARNTLVDKKTSASMGRVEIRREKAGRGGKTVTTLQAFATLHSVGQLERLFYELKKHCACGGTRKKCTIELQGDVRERVFEFLQQHGYAPVHAGG